MRVAHLVDGLSEIGGVQTYLATLLPALRARGVEGVVLAPDAPPEFAGAEAVPLARGSGRGSDGAAGALRSALARARADRLYVHALPPGAAPGLVASYRPLVYAHDYTAVCPGHARYLHTRRSFCEEGPGARCFWRAYAEQCTNRRPDRLLTAFRSTSAWGAELPRLEHVLVASPFVASVLQSAGVSADAVKVVAYPVAPFVPVERSEQATDVLFVGRLVSSKGAHVLVRALAELPGVTAVIAGDGPARPALEALAGELGVADRIRVLGWVAAQQRAGLLDACRIFAMPSLWQEPFGLAGLEALAAAVPVVASEVGGIPSWLPHGEAGLLVAPGDASALAAAIRSLLDDDDRRARLAAHAPVVAARFSVERHLDLLVPELEAAGALSR